MQENSFLLSDGYPGTRPGMVRERHGQHPAFLRTITLASALLKGRKDLPNPDSLHPCDAAEGRRRRGTSRMNTSGINFCCAAPAFFACVSMQKSLETFCRVAVWNPARQISFCRRGRPSVSLGFFVWEGAECGSKSFHNTAVRWG